MSLPVGGVVHLRSHPVSQHHETSVDLAKTKTLEDAEDEDAGLGDERDFKRSQVRGIPISLMHWLIPCSRSVLARSSYWHTSQSV